MSAYQTAGGTCGTVTVDENGAVPEGDGFSNAEIGAVVVGGAVLAGIAAAVGGSDRRR